MPIVTDRLTRVAEIVSPHPSFLDPAGFFYGFQQAPVRDTVSQDLTVVFAVGFLADPAAIGDHSGCAGRVALDGFDP